MVCSLSILGFSLMKKNKVKKLKCPNAKILSKFLLAFIFEWIYVFMSALCVLLWTHQWFDKCLQVVLTISVCGHTVHCLSVEVKLEQVMSPYLVSLFRLLSTCLTWVPSHVEEIRQQCSWALSMGDGITLTSNPPSPQITGLCICVCVCAWVSDNLGYLH